MKALIIFLIFCLCTFSNARFDAFKEAMIISSNSLNYQYSVEDIDAIKVNINNDEIDTKLLLYRGERHEEVLNFSCILLVSNCENDKTARYDEFIQGINLSFKSIKLLFERMDLDLDSVKSVKVWKEKSSSIIAVDEMWGKFTYYLEGRERRIYTQCHRHSEFEPIDCHLASQGNDEPYIESRNE